MTDLNTLLTKARQHAELTGDGAELLAPGVTEAEAHVAAWHAVVVQGGMTSPQREAWRLAVDKAFLTREEADRGCAKAFETVVDTELVARAVGLDALKAWAAQIPAAPVLPASTEALDEERIGWWATHKAGTTTNDRGEFTTPDGTLWHYGAQDGAPPHEGEWISCDGCNPPVVVNTDYMPTFGDLSLSELRARYDDLKAKSKAAEEDFDTAKSALQAALSEASGGALRAVLNVPGFKPVTLTYSEPWTVDSKKLKAEDPATYVKYARKGTRWTLAESRTKS